MWRKGLKPQLVARLAKVLKAEETNAEESNADEAYEDEDADNEDGTTANAQEDSTVIGEEEAAAIEEAYASLGIDLDIDAVVTPGTAEATAADIDMTDIMVIDEYDSTKEKKADKEPKVVPTLAVAKPLDERERRDLEKRYKLPEHPHLIVHPSRTAKGGRFYCNVMSLSIMLDYRPEDTKEHTFEVSLFAELFNEMLMRDFGFNIYKALVALPEPVVAKEAEKDDTKVAEEVTKDEPKEKKAKRSSDDAPTGDGVTADKTESEDRRSSKDKASSDKTSASKRRGRGDDDDTASVVSEARRKSDKDAPKLVRTVDPELLLSFVYFDQTHCGYIFEKDVEELFYTLGLNLSRAQAKKLLAKVVTKDSLHYRQLTDRPKEEEESATASVTGPIDVDALSKGNRCFLPVFRKQAVAAPVGEEKMEEESEENGESGECEDNDFL